MEIHRFLHPSRSAMMPLAMVVGALLCRPVLALEQASGNMITPVLIFSMLFITFCRVRPAQMRPSMLHFWLLLFQLAGSAVLFFALRGLDPLLAQGAMICVLAPVAMAAVVIAGMLGGDVCTMATYSLICNLATALAAPVLLSVAGGGSCTLAGILWRVAPLLIFPFLAAQLCRMVLPAAAEWVAARSEVSFYLWLLSLVVIIGRTTAFLLDLHDAAPGIVLSLAGLALPLCLLQFALGRALGRRFGDAVAGGQSLGQKNTVLAVWMAQSFLDPLSSISPTAYIVWQNFVNSFQMWRRDKEVKRAKKVDEN